MGGLSDFSLRPALPERGARTSLQAAEQPQVDFEPNLFLGKIDVAPVGRGWGGGY